KFFSSKSKYSENTILSKALKVDDPTDFESAVLVLASSLDFKVDDLVTTVTFLPFPLLSFLGLLKSVAFIDKTPNIIIGNTLKFISSYIDSFKILNVNIITLFLYRFYFKC